MLHKTIKLSECLAIAMVPVSMREVNYKLINRLSGKCDVPFAKLLSQCWLSQQD
jgi:hypothetical protein